jgi:DNA-3-methyladenine glycosylase I
MPRCPWCKGHELYEQYHDEEWGVPEYNSQQLFEKLVLDGAQAGLSWWTILNKRNNYREAFDNFDPILVAHYDETKYAELISNAGIVRNKLKIKAAISNAQAYLRLKDRGVELSDYLWKYVDGQPLVNHHKDKQSVPATTALSDEISKILKSDGFKFVGSTIVYAFMQAVGMVNDHLIDCERHQQIINSYH